MTSILKFQSWRLASRRLARELVSPGLLTLLALAGAFQAVAAPATTAADETESAAAGTAGAEDTEDAAESEEWLVDEAGKPYRLIQFPKGVEGRDYIWIDDDTIQIRYGLPVDVVSHDEKTFTTKVYKTEAWERPEPPPEPKDDPEELARVAATYRTEIPAVDRLRFVSFDEGLPRKGQWRNGFDVADMNGDGHLDIVFGPSRKGRPHPNVFLGDGKGKWRRWSEARFPSFPYDYGDAEAADFNDDGHMDVAFAMHLKGIVVLVGDGKGGFRSWSEGIELEIPGKGGRGDSFSSRAIESVDWNGDGRVDLLAVGEGPKGLGKVVAGSGEPPKESRGIIVYLNRGDGTWKAVRHEDKAAIFSDSLAIADFNADGRLDFVTGTSQRGNTRMLHLAKKDGTWNNEPVKELRPRAVSRAIAAADLNGDRRQDLVLGFINRELGVWRTGVDVLLATEGGGWERRSVFAKPGRDGLYGVAAGDVDGDGRPDLVAATGAGELWVFLNDGQGSWVREEASELPAPGGECRGYGVRVVDLDGDGRNEIVAAFAGEDVGLPGLLYASGCADEGSLRVWKAAAASEPASTSTR